MKVISFSLIMAAGLIAAPAPAQVADKVVRARVAGIDLISYPTDVENVVTFRGSLPAGNSLAPPGNVAVPTLVGAMLDKGTTRQDKFAIAQRLDEIGAKISFSVGGVMMEFRGKCLRKDLSVAISLLAEQLRTPAFAEEEFVKVKKQMVGDRQRAMESTEFRAVQGFSETVFSVGHPNYSPPTKDFVAAIENASLADVKAFHAAYYGPAQAILVTVGDIDIEALNAAVAKEFEGWTGGKPRPDFPKATRASEGREQNIIMADKPNVTVLVGQASGLRYSDPDRLALRVATSALGSGFTGRLMANVRDKEGLTYGISAALESDTFVDGAWQISASFAPNLLEKGMASAKRELDQWYSQGITMAELERVKSNLIGTFKVSLTDTDGLANALVNAVHSGYDATWLDEYPKRLAALTLGEVNGTIKKHLRPEKMAVIKAGALPPPATRE